MPGASREPRDRLEAELGYGLGALGGRGVLTPHGGLSWSDGGARRYRLGGRLALGPSLGLSLEAMRRESAGGRAPEHGIGFKLRADW